MKIVFILCIFVSSNVLAKNLGFENAKHLLFRTQFSFDLELVTKLSKMSKKDAVDWVLNKHYSITPIFPHWKKSYEKLDSSLRGKKINQKKIMENFLALKKIMTIQDESMMMNSLNRARFNKINRRLFYPLTQAWWLEVIQSQTNQFNERLTYFWHNHFVSEFKKVKDLGFILDQNQLLRKNALSKFSTLVHNISKDPAMLIYLDSNKNKKKSPNENFSRELLELFTIGIGHYSEKDIKEAAKSFTGWGVNRKKREVVFRKRQHDFSDKSFFGVTKKYGGEEIIDIILSQKDTSKNIVLKIWKNFVSPIPNKEIIEKLTNQFYKNQYNVKLLFKEIFLSDWFYHNDYKATLIKSPIELVLSTYSLSKMKNATSDHLVKLINNIGQRLFDPPNVKGWPGHTYWIKTGSLVARKSVSQKIITSEFRGMLAPKNFRKKKAVAFFEKKYRHYILAMNPVKKIDYKLNEIQYLREITSDPVFQLK